MIGCGNLIDSDNCIDCIPQLRDSLEITRTSFVRKNRSSRTKQSWTAQTLWKYLLFRLEMFIVQP